MQFCIAICCRELSGWSLSRFAPPKMAARPNDHFHTQQVSSNIVDVQRGASETGSASSQVLSAAQSLSRDSNKLKLEVGKFLNSVRVA
jgi:hypothetical protein